MNNLTPRRDRGSILLITFGLIGILATVGALSLHRATAHYTAVRQAQAWQQALSAAEAGVDFALLTLRNEADPSWQDDPWQNWTESTAQDPETKQNMWVKTFTASPYQGLNAGSGRAQFQVKIEAPPKMKVSSAQWFRIRSTGVVDIPGPRYLGGTKLDGQLRKLNFARDVLSGSTTPTPQASRTLEVVLEPKTSFYYALIADKNINFGNKNVIIDSYDSSDPAKSTNGGYDVTKRQQKGDIATNSTAINASGAQIYGSVATNDGKVMNAGLITGEIRTDFYRELVSIPTPKWTSFNAQPTQISTAMTLVGTNDPLKPARYKVSSVDLTGLSRLTIAAPNAGQQAYVEIWVTGDMKLNAKDALTLQGNANVVLFVQGNIAIAGNGLLNTSNRATSVQVYGVGNAQRTLSVGGNGSITAAVYVPNHSVSITSESAGFYGSLICKDITILGGADFHHDEALRGDGIASAYRVASWYEELNAQP